MLILGDVLAIAASLLLAGLSAWALIVGAVLVAPARAEAAEVRVAAKPWASGILGVVLLLGVGTVGLVLLQAVLPGVKLLGMMLLLALLGVGFLGLSGAALNLSRKLRTLEPSLSPYGALSRAAAILVLASFFPLLGWLLVGPATLALGAGAGTLSLVRRSAPSEA